MSSIIPLAYECIMCTRNRPEALAFSVPSLLGQSQPPKRVLIVDASDDHDAVRAVIGGLDPPSGTQIEVVHSLPGSCRQRNLGVRMSDAPILVFADDDSIFAGDCVERMLAVYERDFENRVGAVVGSPLPTPTVAIKDTAATRMRLDEVLRNRLAYPRAVVENRLVPDPLLTLHWALKAGQPRPAWFNDLDAVPAVWARGFCMSYRREALESAGGFDETLRNYAAFEDIDLGISVTEAGYQLVQVQSARVFHNRVSGGRGDSWFRGAENVINRVYVVARHTPRDSIFRRQARRYCAFRTYAYLTGSLWSSAHRDSFRGARTARRCLAPLLEATPAESSDAFAAVMRRVVALHPAGQPAAEHSDL